MHIFIHLKFIMLLKQFYEITTKVSSRKIATTFGDIPDCCTDSPLQDCCIVLLITSKHSTHSNTGTLTVAE